MPWVLIPVATLLVYWPAVHGGLIMDDIEHITPPALRSPGGLISIWCDVGATPHYYPVLNSVFWLEYHVWADSPVGYHLINIAQQAMAACLVVLLTRRLKLPGATLAGVLFAIHPVHVESVAWISEQKNTLSTLLALASALFYFDYHEKRRTSRYWLASVLFLLALLSKTVVAVVPPAILVTLWWRQGRLDWRRDVAPLLPWFAIGAGLGLFSAWFEQVHSHAQGDAFELAWVERVLIAGRAVCFYARTLAWPSDLMFINPRWVVNPESASDYVPFGAVVLVGIGLLLAARRWRGPLATYLLFVGMLFPVLGLLNINWFNFSFVANHFQHLPSIALIIPMAAAFTLVSQRLAALAAPRLIMTGVWAITMGWIAHLHCEEYRTPERLYAATLEKNPTCWLAHNNLGVLLMEQPGQLVRATLHFERALALKPDHARAHNNYATALLRADRVAEGLEHYRRSLALQEQVAEVHCNYANALAGSGGPADEALAHFERALELRPGYADACLGRADVLAGLPGRTAEAVVAYREAIRWNPNSAEACNNLGTLLSREEATMPEAIHWLGRAIELAPDYPDAHFNLGVLLAKVPGQSEASIAQLRQVARLRPDDVEVHLHLASMLARSPERLAEAVEHLEKVVLLQPGSALAHVRLAQVLAGMPARAADALGHYRQALVLDPGNRVARDALARAGMAR